MGKHSHYVLFAIAALVLLVGSDTTMAATSATPDGGSDVFSAIYSELEKWTQGFFGKLIALAMVVTGIVMGIQQQSIWAFAIGMAAALWLVYLPLILESIFTLGLMPAF